MNDHNYIVELEIGCGDGGVRALQEPAGDAFVTTFPREGRPSRFNPTEQLWRRMVAEGHLTSLRSRMTSTSGNRICDIGAADGSLTGYLSTALGMTAAAYDIVLPTEKP